MDNKFGKPKTGFDKSNPVFSFKNYKESKFFKESDVLNKREFHKFFTNIKNFSQFTWEKIKTDKKTFHFHEIDDDKNINSKLGIESYVEVVQFKIPGDKESRILGYFDEKNIFNIVAYDYKHKVYPRN